MTVSLCNFEASDCAAPAAHHGDTRMRSKAEAALAILITELGRHSAHGHDSTEAAALALLEDFRDPGHLTARAYQALHCRIRRCRGAHDDAAPAEWLAIHRASCQAFTRLLWVWRSETGGGALDSSAAARQPLAGQEAHSAR